MEERWAASGIDLLLEGEWRPGSISASFDPNNKRPTTPAIEEQIAREWAAAEREAVQHDRLLFAGPLVRVLRYASGAGGLNFWLGPTDYREYLGTRHLEEPDFRADPLSACAVVRTADGKLVLGRRGHRNMESPGWWHMMAGYVDPTLDQGGEGVDLFASILREIEEEAGFDRKEVSVVCLGLMKWRTTHKPELIFAVDASRTSREIHPVHDEHDEIRAVEDNPQAIREFLVEADGLIAEAGLACLKRYTAWRHGETL